MEELSSDPADLFSSVYYPSPDDAVAPPLSMPVSKPNFYIIPPVLSAEEKELYKTPDQSSLNSENEAKRVEVIGEWENNGERFYFARHGGDLAHKFPVGSFTAKYPGPVKEYRRKKSTGKLKPFDPSALSVHPSSRFKIKLRLGGKNMVTAKGKAKNGMVSNSDDDYDGTDEMEQYSSDDEYESSSQQGRVTTRRTRRTAKLPFSPRKSRLRRAIVIDDSDESSSEARPAQRRSKRIKSDIVAAGFESSSSISSYREVRKTRNDARPKKVRSKKPVKPAYGHVHDISDVEYESDDELACLRRHRNICAKCHEGPAHDLLNKFKKRSKNKSSRKKPMRDELDESDDEGERLNSLGGWVRCLKCPVVAHWKCLAGFQRDEILKAMREKDLQQAENLDAPDPDSKPKKRSDLGIRESTDFICGACSKGGICMGCMNVAAVPHAGSEVVPTEISDVEINKEQSQQLLFRCFTCKRPSHYEHLPRPASLPADSSLTDIALYYQDEKSWSCADCSSYVYDLDKILAWRPYPPDVVEPSHSPDEPPNYKDPLPREYLVKWVGRSYRRTQWVPHMWLLSTNPGKLKNFITSGARIELHRGDERSKVQEDADLLETAAISPDVPTQGPLSLDAFPDAEQHIPLAWKTIDRILDVLLWRPDAKRKKGVQENSDVESAEAKLQAEYDAVFESGRQPSQWNTEEIPQWESRKKYSITTDNIGDVIWIFVKWDDLNYGEATWDSPPRPDEPGYESFAKAFERYVRARDVRIPKYTDAELRQVANRPRDEYRHRHRLKNAADLKLGQNPDLLLLPFQVDGFNWLTNNWWNHQPCILADEMGLGKTVQIVTFLGRIAAEYQAMPALVVVPNSTITNWVREFERWAPNLRVVPYYGDAKAREIIRSYELYHKSPKKGSSHAKYHVLVATYETLLHKGEFTPVFKSERWEVLVVDEGQRLKSDSSLLFKKLKELNTSHRIIMTGTPLNNNIRELFNLMNFLDPENWDNLDALEKEYEKLTEDLVKQLHNLLRPYFLRRIKSEVLQLPPKNEVIVPMSMASLQREVYRSILSKNVDILKGLTQPTGSKSAVTKRNVHNILMQLRKCLQHPYLYDDGIEPRDLTPEETHGKLIDASAKFRLLKILLPKLKARGHRVLLFSQFVIALDVIEDFLQGEGFKFSRLDGNTNSYERQKGMDEFNRPGSDIFIYLLSTRAGGVGINLYTADTVIIFDPDFNPHQDLQAISRAYRYGQKKTCLVFKFMVKDSAEERIMQIGKKKLVLDHLIVQKMDDEDSVGEDVQSILTFGAKALFESEQESRDIIYTDQDIDKLIEKTEHEGETQEEVKDGAFSFSFAKVWAADKDVMEDIQDDDQTDSWAQTLQKVTAEREKQQMQEIVASGRGVRRAAASYKPNYVVDDGTPDKTKKKAKSKPIISDTSSYSASDGQSDDESSGNSDAMDVDFVPLFLGEKSKDAPRIINGISAHQYNEIMRGTLMETEECGLCGQVHGPSGECFMTDKSEYLAEYREMLIKYANDEPWEDRSAAIKAIDETLHKRGHLGLIAGQPLHPLPTAYMAGASAPAPRAGDARNEDVRSAGSLKRPGSPANEIVKKKPKPIPTSSCPICNRSPHHLVKDCPIVAAGPQSIAEQLKRLESSTDPAATQTVDILRNILSKQRKRD